MIGAIDAVIDVSHYQERVDFNRVRRAGVVAVWHKATQGSMYVDPRFAPRRELAKGAGLLYGAYHFGTGEDPLVQARHLLAVTEPGDLLALDVERNPGGAGMTLNQAITFCAYIVEKRKRRPVVYGGGDYLRDVLAVPVGSPLAQSPLWWAQYGPRPTRLPKAWTSWTFWQHTDGKVGSEPKSCDGVGPCDRDAFNGDEAALRAFWTGAAP